jgi:hypothetical protein
MRGIVVFLFREKDLNKFTRFKKLGFCGRKDKKYERCDIATAI